MSMKYSLKNLTEEERLLIDKKLTIRVDDPKSKYTKYLPAQYVYSYRIDDGNVRIPFAWGLSNISPKRPQRSSFPALNGSLSAHMRPNQIEVFQESIKCLNKKGSCLLSLPCGFGKTFLAIALANRIKLRTIVLVNKIVLQKQWVESIEKFSDCSVSAVRPATKAQRQINSKARKKWKNSFSSDFVVINAINVEKIPQDILRSFGTVIVDECHLIMSKCMSNSLLYIEPRYLIGLSATPYRTDGLNVLLDIFFSERRITRILHKPHLVFEVITKFKPTVELTRNGTLNWNTILSSQSESVDRNNMIVNMTITLVNLGRTILILTKRVKQAQYLVDELHIRGVVVSGLFGSSQSFNKKCDVLVGTSSKVGVGFDHSNLDCLILASDLEQYFIQYLGRVFRNPNTIPIVVDLIDNHPTLKKHYRTRKKTYTRVGGKVVKCSSPSNVAKHLSNV